MPHASSPGFTLMEIMVVLLILSLTMGLSIASIHGGFGGSDFKTNLRRMHALFTDLRHQAMLDGKPQILHLDMDGLDQAEYWIENKEKETAEVPKKPLLIGDTTLVGIKIGSLPRQNSGEVGITFSSRGLAQPTRFYLQDKGQQTTLILQAFSPDLKVEEEP
jgi:prepilin-type N-terminal cleavage/methylation domain-containing protein